MVRCPTILLLGQHMATCGEALVRMLKNYGVTTVFGIPGVHTIELYRGLPATGIRHITPRHEQGAGFMADGYARACGKPGVCFVITGPGMTNIATAMGQALGDSIPMLVISSVNRTRQLGMGEGYLHELPGQRELVAGVSVFSHRVTDVDQLPRVLARAFSVFCSARPGPVHIEIPVDVITADAGHLDTDAFPMPSAPAAAPDAITRAARLLKNARRPVIVVGGGTVDASGEVVAIAEKLDAPVINTVNAKGVIPRDHALAVGGSGSCDIIRRELAEADVVLAVGTEFGETDYDYFFTGPVTVGGKLIRIDIDPAQLTRNLRPHLAIQSDAALALQALGDTLPASARGNGAQRAQALRSGARAIANPQYAAFFTTLNAALPELIIAGDSTQPTYYAWLCYETEAPRRYFHSASGYGTLGYAIPAAIGAKLGQPDKPVLALIGDGAAQFTIGELASAVEARVPVIFLLWNNSGYAEIRRFMDSVDVARVGVDIHTPDFKKIGEGFGCATAHPTTLDELHAALVAANRRQGPTLIEVTESDFVADFPFP